MMLKPMLCVVGVGTVGLTVVQCFACTYKVIAFDIDRQRIAELKRKYDRHHLFSKGELSNPNILFTSSKKDMARANFYIVTVPSNFESGRPNLYPLLDASHLIGSCLKKNDLVVYESTVYPGVTEHYCIPILEKISGLKSPADFAVGYSPERVNPGDKAHHLPLIKKIVGAQDQNSLRRICRIYKKVIAAGVVSVSSIKVAEVTKIIENTQRDVQISFMNEVAFMLHKMNINTSEVLKAMSTKWNYVPFSPGLVGGTCIGKDSNYLIFKAQKTGYYPHLILAARHINNYVARYIAEKTIKILLHNNINILKARILVCGITYKENYNETTNSKVFDIIAELKKFRTNLLVHDPLAHSIATKKNHGVELVPWNKIPRVDAIIFAVGHKEYRILSTQQILKKLKAKGTVIDIKSIFYNIKETLIKNNITYWQL